MKKVATPLIRKMMLHAIKREKMIILSAKEARINPLILSKMIDFYHHEVEKYKQTYSE